MQPHLYPHQRALVEFGSRRWGKSAMIAAIAGLNGFSQQLSRGALAARELRSRVYVIHDELYHSRLGHYEIIERDRSHFERGGRYRKPPAAKNVVTKEPGMVQVRARDGSLTWKKLGAGKASR